MQCSSLAAQRTSYTPRVLVPCDGSVHDAPDQQERERVLREELLLHGYTVVVLRYNLGFGVQNGRSGSGLRRACGCAA